jgi:hypothetical protein
LPFELCDQGDRTVSYHDDAAAYVFAGSEPSMMRELFDSRERPLFGQALPISLGPLPGAAVIDDLLARFDSEDLEPGVALGALVAFAGGHPQRTMLFAYLLADALAAGAQPTPALADEMISEALRLTDPVHQALWQAAGPVDRAVLAAVADGIAPTAQRLADQHNVARSTLGDAAERLSDQGHLIRDGRKVQLVDPLLGEWLRRR